MSLLDKAIDRAKREVQGRFIDPAIANGAARIKQALSGFLPRKDQSSTARNIDDVIANVQSDFARPNLFQVEIGKVKASAQKPFTINCYQTQIPGSNILTTERDIGFRQFAYQQAYADIILGFYSSGNLRELKFFQDWMDKIVNRKTKHFNYYSEYTDQVVIKQLTRHIGNPMAGKWILHDAYPKQVDPIQLDYGTNDTIISVNVTMTYRHFTPSFPVVPVGDSITGPLYAQSSNTDMNKIDPMWEIRNEGWKFGQGEDNDPNQDMGPEEY